jgi:23S rRNA pseudouridine955/2504/2580 synthase
MSLPNKAYFLTVTEYSGAGQRIDNFLVKELKNVPKSKIYSILRRGEVRVNKGRIKPSYKLQAEDIVRVPPLTNVEPEPGTVRPITSKQIDSFNLEAAIIYEDSHLLIINKPSGLAVHGGSGLSFGLIEMLRAMRPNAPHLELIHRIDRDTSGCVMIAKSVVMLRGMHGLFRSSKIKKIYHTLVKGYASEKFIVDEPLKKFVLASGERLVRVHPEGQPSVTEFTVLKRYNGATLLQAAPITGRTHQIRVHAAQRGLPIVGDQKYGNKEYNQITKQLGLKRLYLHARELNFVCPISNVPINVQAEYDQDWNNGLENLAKGRNANDDRQ